MYNVLSVQRLLTGLLGNRRRLVERGLVERGLVERGLVERGLVERGLVERGLGERGLVERGLGERGLGKRRLSALACKQVEWPKLSFRQFYNSLVGQNPLPHLETYIVRFFIFFIFYFKF